MYRNFIPNGGFVRGRWGIGVGLGVDRGRIRVSDLNFRGVSGVEQLAASATLSICHQM